MIQDQVSTSYNYHPSRFNFFNITANRVDPPKTAIDQNFPILIPIFSILENLYKNFLRSN
jgi:hypothetical protein